MTAGRRILVVCTANICRSPVAERLIARHVGPLMPVTVASAGTHGGRLDVHEDTVRAAAQLDVDLRDHRSRPLTERLIDDEGSDLVITMTREHLREVVGRVPEAWPRSFTLKELVRRALDVSADVRDFESWVGAASEGRRAAELMTPSDDDDVADPYGGPAAGHVAMVREVADLAERLSRLMPQA